MKSTAIKLVTRAFNFLFPALRRELCDLSARIDIQNEKLGYIPWNGSAMRPSLIRLIQNEIILGGRRRVLEIGTRISTMYLSGLLQRCGGALTTVDHDAQWQKTILSRIPDSSAIETIAVELVEQVIDGRKCNYYDCAKLKRILAGKRFDCLLVDAPIATPGSMTRYPALPVFSRISR